MNVSTSTISTWPEASTLSYEYAIALWQSICERMSVAGMVRGFTKEELPYLHLPSKSGHYNHSFCELLRASIFDLVGKFVDADVTKENRDESMYVASNSTTLGSVWDLLYEPYALDPDNIIRGDPETYNITILPSRGSPATSYIPFLTRCKNWFDQMTHTATIYRGSDGKRETNAVSFFSTLGNLAGYGGVWTNQFDSFSEALAYAQDNTYTYTSDTGGLTPYLRPGTHKWYRARIDLDHKDWYSIHLERQYSSAFFNHAGIACDIDVFAWCDERVKEIYHDSGGYEPPEYVCLAYTQFDSFGHGWQDGMNRNALSVPARSSVDIDPGKVSDLKLPDSPPVPDMPLPKPEGDGAAISQAQLQTIFFANFAVPGGFTNHVREEITP